MGFAASITTIILFVAIMIIGTIVYPTLFHSYEYLQEARDDNHEIRLDQLNTAVDITNVVKSGADTYIITVSNKGTTVLHANKSNVLVDGWHKPYTVTPSGFWMPQTNAVFTFNASTATNHIMKIISENGMSDIDTI
jgi:archaellum component FlaF (FlaF/FlaG flagellin family)